MIHCQANPVLISSRSPSSEPNQNRSRCHID
jgi:hypothetical protein